MLNHLSECACAVQVSSFLREMMERKGGNKLLLQISVLKNFYVQFPHSFSTSSSDVKEVTLIILKLVQRCKLENYPTLANNLSSWFQAINV